MRRAVAKAREGDAPLALTHLALAGAEALTEPHNDARRLFIANGLMKAGVSPQAIIEALGAPSTRADLDRAYNPDQPRVPAGTGGRPWTSGDWDDDTGDADDASAPPGAENAATNAPTQGVQIVGASGDWAQHLDPFAPAEAAGGAVSVALHQERVAAAIAHYQALGYVLPSPAARPLWTFQDSRRRASMISSSVPNGFLIGVEVKTTLGDTIFLNPIQVAEDVALMLGGREGSRKRSFDPRRRLHHLLSRLRQD